MSWQKDEQGRKFFRYELDKGPREAFEQAVMEEPPTDDGWFFLLWTYIDLVNQQAPAGAQVPFGTALQIERLDEFQDRTAAAESGTRDLSPDQTQAASGRQPR